MIRTLRDSYGNRDPNEAPYLVLKLTEKEINDLFYFCVQPPTGWRDQEGDGDEETNRKAVLQRAESGVVRCPGTFTGETLRDTPLRREEVDTLLEIEKLGAGSFFSGLLEKTRSK